MNITLVHSSFGTKFVVLVMIICQICCPTTERDEQNTPTRVIQSSMFHLNWAQHTSSMSVTLAFLSTCKDVLEVFIKCPTSQAKHFF